jgi:histidine triad (HIT) family protein
MPQADPNCIFCKIVAGAIPCYKLFEDDHVLSFLDIGPLSRGHLLVIPRQHAVTLDELDEPSTMACAAAARRLGKAACEVTGVKDWNLLQNNGKLAGQVVMHVHIHVIPRREGDGLGFRWPAGKLEKDEAVALAAAITGKL